MWLPEWLFGKAEQPVPARTVDDMVAEVQDLLQEIREGLESGEGSYDPSEDTFKVTEAELQALEDEGLVAYSIVKKQLTLRFFGFILEIV